MLSDHLCSCLTRKAKAVWVQESCLTSWVRCWVFLSTVLQNCTLRHQTMAASLKVSSNDLWLKWPLLQITLCQMTCMHANNTFAVALKLWISWQTQQMLTDSLIFPKKKVSSTSLRYKPLYYVSLVWFFSFCSCCTDAEVWNLLECLSYFWRAVAGRAFHAEAVNDVILSPS